MSESRTKTDWQKYLKTLAICLIVIDLIFIVLGAIVAAGIVDPEFTYGLFDLTPEMVGAMGADIQTGLTIVGIILIVVYAVNLLISLLVLRGAKNPSKIKPAMILTGISAAVSVVALVQAAMAGDPFGTAFGQAFLVVVEFYGTIKVNQLNK